MGETPDETLRVPQGAFTLRRHGDGRAEGLRAWDAADEYVLHEAAERGLWEHPDPALMAAMQQVYLEVEGELEE